MQLFSQVSYWKLVFFSYITDIYLLCGDLALWCCKFSWELVYVESVAPLSLSSVVFL